MIKHLTKSDCFIHTYKYLRTEQNCYCQSDFRPLCVYFLTETWLRHPCCSYRGIPILIFCIQQGVAKGEAERLL